MKHLELRMVFITGVLVLLVGCSWPKVKIGEEELLFSPFPGGQDINLTDSSSGSGSAESGVNPSESTEKNN